MSNVYISKIYMPLNMYIETQGLTAAEVQKKGIIIEYYFDNNNNESDDKPLIRLLPDQPHGWSQCNKCSHRAQYIISEAVQGKKFVSMSTNMSTKDDSKIAHEMVRVSIFQNGTRIGLIDVTRKRTLIDEVHLAIDKIGDKIADNPLKAFNKVLDGKQLDIQIGSFISRDVEISEESP